MATLTGVLSDHEPSRRAVDDRVAVKADRDTLRGGEGRIGSVLGTRVTDALILRVAEQAISAKKHLSAILAISIAIAIPTVSRGQEGVEVTQTFSDLELTQPSEDEITAPPADLDTSFPPLGAPVAPGPPVEVDAHFWDEQGPPAEEVEEERGALEKSSGESLPFLQAAEGNWRLAGRTGMPGSGNVAIHAALLRSTVLPSGAEILFFAGDAHTPEENIKGNVDRTGVFRLEPATNRFLVQEIPSLSTLDPSADLFCSGHALLEDGRLLVAGGTDRFESAMGVHAAHFTAIRSSFIFDPKTNSWSQTSPMNLEPGPNFEPGTTEKTGGRWYPTLLTLNSNRVLALWGHPAVDETTRHTNDTPEYFALPTATWHILGRENDVRAQSAKVLGYPRVHLLPNGRVLRATPVEGLSSGSPPQMATGSGRSFNGEINPIPESLADRNDISSNVSVAPGRGYGTGNTAYTSVLLPLTPANKYRARILLAGGGACPNDICQSLRPQILELPAGIPRGKEPLPDWCKTKPEDRGEESLATWCNTGARDPALAGRARLHANATILPTGEVLLSGGKSESGAGSLDRSKVQEGEIYDPFSDTWRVVAPARVPREYHSTALLMPDGRVWHGGTSIDGARGLAAQETRIELYEPWYYTRARPVIRSVSGPQDPIYRGAPLMHLHDTGVTVVVDHFGDVSSKFALVRAGTVTHAFNSDQRYIELEAELLDRQVMEIFRLFGFVFNLVRSTFRLTSPPSSSIAPPGNYMLFAIDDTRVPSVGRFIRIDRQFVGELKQEAEEFTTRGAVPVSVRKDGTVFMRATRATDRAPFDLFPVLEYGGIDFGPEEGVVTRLSALVSSPTGGAFHVHLDKPDGPRIASLQISSSNGKLIEQETSVGTVGGVHNVFVRFTPLLPEIPLFGRFARSATVTVDWFKFK